MLVIGSGGAGKSTVARELSQRTGLPVIHLDAEYWRPGWIETPKDEWAARVARLIEGDAWVMDGNYGGTLPPRLAASDTVIFLDLPRVVCAWRVVRRWLRHRGHARPDMAAGCDERLSLEFLRWIWEYPRTRRPGILAALAALAALRGGQRVIVLRSRAEVRAFLRTAAQSPAGAPTAEDVQREGP